GGAARGHPGRSDRVGPGRTPTRRRGAAQPRPTTALPAEVPDRQGVCRGAQVSDAEAGERRSARYAGQVGAVLRELRQGPARTALRAEDRIWWRAAGDD